MPTCNIRPWAACLAWILGAAPIAIGAQAADDCHPPAIQPGASTRDRIELRQDGNAVLVDIHRVTGIGNAILRLPAPGAAATVTVRLHAFPALDNFIARDANAALECGQERPEGMPARLICRIGENRTDAIRQEPGYFEVTLPSALLESGASVDIHWVDQWR
jgi:hypothetical protein